MQQEVLCVAFESIVGKQNCITDPEIIKTYLEDWRGIHVGLLQLFCFQTPLNLSHKL